MLPIDKIKDFGAAQEIPYVIPQLDDDVIAGWRWWLKQEEGGNRCPSTRTDMCCEYGGCQRFCLPIFTKIRGGALNPGTTFEEWCNATPDCPCLRYGSIPVRPIVAKVLAAQEPFEPYAAVFTDTDGTQEIIMVEWDGEYGFGDDSHTLYDKHAVKRIANPGIALKILNRLHPPEHGADICETCTPAEHAERYASAQVKRALNKLEKWLVEYSRISLGHMPDQDTLHSKVVSLRKAADTLKGGDGLWE